MNFHDWILRVVDADDKRGTTLVCADWLEEQGSPHSGSVRLAARFPEFEIIRRLFVAYAEMILAEIPTPRGGYNWADYSWHQGKTKVHFSALVNGRNSHAYQPLDDLEMLTPGVAETKINNAAGYFAGRMAGGNNCFLPHQNIERWRRSWSSYFA